MSEQWYCPNCGALENSAIKLQRHDGTQGTKYTEKCAICKLTVTKRIVPPFVLALQERIAALESHLTMLQNGTSIPFPAVTDRHLIDSIKEKTERLTAQEAEIAALRKVAEGV